MAQAERGQGAFSELLWDASSPAVRVRVAEGTAARDARFMESVESRHSSHSDTAAVVRGERWPSFMSVYDMHYII